MAKYNRPNGKLFGSSATNIGVFGSGQQNETPTTSTDPNTINTLGTHWEDGWNGAVVSQAPYTAPYVEDMNAVNYVNSYNSAYLLQRGIAEYSATEEYQKDSLCTFNSEIWMCKLDNTVGQTPAEGTYWHLQGEVPIMNDNEILVGAVGGTPTVVDTNGQGDVLASATGLNIKAGAIVNADIDASAAIAESKLALDYSTSSLNSTISGHIADTANPHSVTKAQVLSGDLIVNADVDASAAIAESKLDLDYATNTLNTNIGTVSTNLGNHTGNKNNPHETGISNLNDVVLSTPVQDGDVISFDIGSGKYINRQPAGGALSTLSDTTISSPTDKQLVQYDYANSKWVNSSDVWDTIGANDVAYVGTTPQGHTIDGSNNVTMLSSDNRYQIITYDSASNYNIKLPSTGIKAGETFIFDFTKLNSISTGYIQFVASDSSSICYQYNNGFSYIFSALNDDPSTSSDWLFYYKKNQDIIVHGDYSTSVSATQNTRVASSSSDLFSIGAGTWDLSMNLLFSRGSIGTTEPWTSTIAFKSGNGRFYGYGGSLGVTYTGSIPLGAGGTFTLEGATIYYNTQHPIGNRIIGNVNKAKLTAYGYTSIYNTGASVSIYYELSCYGTLVAPKTDALS